MSIEIKDMRIDQGRASLPRPWSVLGVPPQSRSASVHSVSAESAQLLLRPDTTVTCPKCADEFSLDQGFAKKALEQLAETSAHAIAAVRDAERAQVEKRAQQLALEHARAAQDEAEGLKKLLKEQSEAHAKALAEVRTLAEESVAPRIEEMQKALNERDNQLKALRGREEALAAREKDLESRVKRGRSGQEPLK